jgi:predicted RNA-binding Zn-ribbon protein involved in translation (DUF1610 family)
MNMAAAIKDTLAQMLTTDAQARMEIKPRNRQSQATPKEKLRVAQAAGPTAQSRAFHFQTRSFRRSAYDCGRNSKQGVLMAAKAGEIARESAMYACESCARTLPVHQGTPIPNCPSCGNESFQTGARSLRNKSPVPVISGFANFP